MLGRHFSFSLLILGVGEALLSKHIIRAAYFYLPFCGLKTIEVCSFCGIENPLYVEQQCHGGGFMGPIRLPARLFSALQLPWRYHNRAQWPGDVLFGGT